LVGLQAFADQLGIAIRRELYGEALEARHRAEKAEQLKTRLLANVSHELRTRSTSSWLQRCGFCNPYKADLPPAMLNDLNLIYRLVITFST
jgi:GAF domain-containing protein